MSRSLNAVRLLTIFGLLLALLIAAVSHDFRPRPIYPKFVWDQSQRTPLNAIHEDESLMVEFAAPAAHFNAAYWGEIFSSIRQEIEVSLFNVTQDRLIGRDIIHTAKPTSFFGAGDNAAGETLRLELRWLADAAPRIAIVHRDPNDRGDYSLSIDGQLQSDVRPCILLSREKPSKLAAKNGTPLPPPGSIGLTKDGQAICADSEEVDWLPLSRGSEMTIEFTVLDDDLHVLSIPGFLADERSKAHINITNLSSGETLANSVAMNGKFWEKPIVSPARGDRLRIQFRRDSIEPPIPHRTHKPSSIPLHAFTDADKKVDPPLFIAQYRWPTRNLPWLWPLLAVFLLATLRRPRLLPAFLVTLGLLASMTGLLLWQQQYSGFEAHLDPDEYGAFAEHLVEFGRSRDETAHNELVQWFHEYSNAEVPLPSLILALMGLMGLPIAHSYLWMTGMCAFGTLLTVHHILRRYLSISPPAALLAVTAMGCNLAILNSFARPSPDMPGLLLTTLMLGGIFWRLRETSLRQSIWLALLPLLLLLSRHGSPAYMPFYFGAIIAADILRERTFAPRLRLKTLLVLAAPPLLIYALLFLGFNWSHNLAIAMARNRDDTAFNGYSELLRVLLGTIQLFLLTWIALPFIWKSRPDLRPAIAVSCGWMLYFVTFMVAVDASMVQRLFLPLIPVLVVLFACTIDRAALRRTWTLACVVILAAACNLAVVYYVIHLPYLPPANIARFIY